MTIESKIAELTAQKVNDLVNELTIKTYLSAIASVVGIVGGLKAKNQFLWYGSLILGVLGIIGLLVFLPELIQIIHLLP